MNDTGLTAGSPSAGRGGCRKAVARAAGRNPGFQGEVLPLGTNKKNPLNLMPYSPFAPMHKANKATIGMNYAAEF